MKKLIFTLYFFAFFAGASAVAQVLFGLKAGISTTQVKPSTLDLTDANNVKAFSLALEKANYGYHLGGFLQIPLGSLLYLQPELLFNATSTDFKVENLQQSGLATRVLTEKYQNLDIPLMLGFHIGIINVFAGPVGHVFLNSSSELIDVSGYSQKFDEVTYGWQGGVGVRLIWGLSVDVRYEGNFDNYGNHISFGGRQFNFDKKASRILASVAYTF